jgi:hypothetical protein
MMKANVQFDWEYFEAIMENSHECITSSFNNTQPQKSFPLKERIESRKP